jgi:hypothetical protein
VEKATTLNLCSTQFRPKVLGKTIHTIIGSVGIAIANFIEHPPTLSGGMVGIPTYLTDFLGMSSVHYLSLQLGGIMWRLRIVARNSFIGGVRRPCISFVITLLYVCLLLGVVSSETRI